MNLLGPFIFANRKIASVLLRLLFRIWKEKIREMLTLWQVPENIITALERNDESFDKTFIFDVIYGADYEKRKESQISI